MTAPQTSHKIKILCFLSPKTVTYISSWEGDFQNK